MSLPNEPENGQATSVYTLCAIGLLIVVAIATAASWHVYPLFIDTYYHMAVIEGFAQAGGITTRAFWEMAPGGRVHIYPPSLHAIGYFFHLLGVSPGTYMTLVSASFYGGCLLTTWIWLRRVIGARSALLALALLCGPSAFFWTQATFQAAAGVMVLAPLALLALESERFLACGVLNLVAMAMHPMGLFLPPALVINTLLRRKKLWAGLLAASVPVLLYGPWLAHVWANRAFLPEHRTGGEITLGGFGGGASLGLLLVPLAALAVPWLVLRRGPALGLIGALLGFAAVFPMGFGGRFLAFNIHWPLACLGGYGLGELVRWLETRPSLRAAGHVLSIVVAAVALLAYPAVNLPMGGPRGGRPPGGPPMGERMPQEPRPMFADWRVTVQAGALPKLFEAYSGAGIGPGMGPGPMGPGPMGPGPGGGPGMGPGGFPGGFPGGGPGMGPGGFPGRFAGGFPGGGPGMAPGGFPGGGPGMGPGGFPGAFPGGGPGRSAGAKARPASSTGGEGRQPASGPPSGPGPQGKSQPQTGPLPQAGLLPQAGQGRDTAPGRAARRGMPGGMAGMNLLTRDGAEDFFEAIKANVDPGDVIHIDDPPAASLLVGVTGRWTSSGMLRDVRSENGRVRPEECDFAAVLGGGMGMPGPGGPMGFRSLPSGFEKVFENDYGTLYRNPAKVEHAREPTKAEVSLPLLAGIGLVGVLLVLIDLVPVPRGLLGPAAAGAGTLVVALCLVPLTRTAIGELRDPPSAPPRGGEGGPGFGPPGFGGPGFGPPGFGPGQFLAPTFLREADADKSGAASLEEFKALAGHWFEGWDADRSGSLELGEVPRGLESVFGPPPGAGGPMAFPGGPGPLPGGPAGSPGGFGPDVLLARRIFLDCDANGDGKVTREEMAAAFERWFRQWDEGSKGSLDAAALAAGLDRLVLGPPPVPGDAAKKPE